MAAASSSYVASSPPPPPTLHVPSTSMAPPSAPSIMTSSSPTSVPGLWNIHCLLNQKDSRWLQLEVCREFQRNMCCRSDIDCKFAHPSPNVEVQNGRVTACYDSIKGRCNREKPPCKYFHPPLHLKDQLLVNGRNHLALKNALMQQMTLVATAGTPQFFPPPQVHTVASPYGGTALPHLAAYSATGAPYLPVALHSQIMHPADLGASDPSTMAAVLLQQQQQMAAVAAATAQQQQSKPRCDRIGVCPDFQHGGSCKHADCRLAHPSDGVTVSEDGSVTLCIDHEKRRCYREPCRYFHRPDDVNNTSSAPSPPASQALAFSTVVPYKRPASNNKSGQPVYQPAVPASHQQALLQLHQPFVPVTYTSQGHLAMPRFQ